LTKVRFTGIIGGEIGCFILLWVFAGKKATSMAFETVLASVTIEVGPHSYHAAIVRRGSPPAQSYHIKKGPQYQEFDGKGDDNAATVLGLTNIALLLGQELDGFARPKGPEAEQISKTDIIDRTNDGNISH
jgi:hypothetical protein